jgi:(2Fe-2S) ferredoxin
VINYHYYSNNSTPGSTDFGTEGMAPELTNGGAIADAFVRLGKAYHLPVWITETGYDINPGSPQKAIPIGNKSALITQADWIIRTSFLYARHGINRVFFYELYDDNPKNPTQYSSSGLASFGQHRPAADYIDQAKKVMGNFTYKGTISHNPIVDVYRNGNKTIYALMVPDEKGRSVNAILNLGNAVKATEYQFNPGNKDMIVSPLNADASHNLKIKVTETPVFVEKVD